MLPASPLVRAMSDAPDVPVATIPKNVKEEVRIALSQWRGYNLAHLRVFTDATGRPERVPTKAGFGIQVARLPDLIAALQSALVEARARGWLE